MTTNDRAPAAGQATEALEIQVGVTNSSVTTSGDCTPTTLADSSENSLLQATLDYVSRGWCVFPCHTPHDGGCSCGDPDCTNVGKHPRTQHGLKDATVSEERITQWWNTWPNANIGLATGVVSGIVALDVDPRHSGDETLRKLEEQYSPLPETVESLTGGGGRHILFTHPGVPVKNSTSTLGPGLDVRGDAGYIIVPPSLHASGQQYTWEICHEPDDTPLAPLPEWLLHMITAPSSTSSGGNGANSTNPIPEGARNDTLFRLASSLRAKGLSEAAILAAVLETNRERCQPPLPESEVRQIVASVTRYEAGDLFSHNSLFSQPEFPEISETAFYGLAGDFVRTVAPHTEASPVALLIQFLVAFGIVVGRRPYFQVEADWHHINLFAVLVGDSSKARKGTSAGHVRRLFAAVDERFTESQIVSGLSSGEGLIWAVRDPITKRERTKKDSQVQYTDVVIDQGVVDKRLLVLEPEFAQALKTMHREGNILSPIIRQAWDTGNLRTLVKTNPARATGAHIGIIGHITGEELQRHLTETEAANGFGNRFLWVCTRRSQCLPEGGSLSEGDLKPLVATLRSTLTVVQAIQCMQRDEEARALWHTRYPALSEGKPGLLGALCTRAEAQVLRLSCLYALLDQSATIRRLHLEAALALWDYAEASATYLFGATLGDPLADDILRMLRAAPEGRTRTDISNALGRHRKAGEIGAALARLTRKNLVQCVTRDSGGRPVEVWYAMRFSEYETAK